MRQDQLCPAATTRLTRAIGVTADRTPTAAGSALPRTAEARAQAALATLRAADERYVHVMSVDASALRTEAEGSPGAAKLLHRHNCMWCTDNVHHNEGVHYRNRVPNPFQDNSLPADRPVSPAATGGSGFTYEYGVAGLLLSRLLRGAHLPIGAELPLTRVALQQRNNGFPFDDIVASSKGSGIGPRIQMQVKQSLHASGSNTDFVQVMQAARNILERNQYDLATQTLQLGLVTGNPQVNLIRLTEIARAHADSNSNVDMFRPGITNAQLRKQYEHVTTALTLGYDSPATPRNIDEIAHRILASLHVWHVDAHADGSEWRAELDALSSIAHCAGTTPVALLEHLCRMAREFGPHSGDINSDHIRATLRGRYGITIDSADQKTSLNNTILNNYGNIVTGQHQIFNNADFRISK